MDWARIAANWARITEAELDAIDGARTPLAAQIRASYGLSGAAQMQLESWQGVQQ